jgi:hypothetical protein
MFHAFDAWQQERFKPGKIKGNNPVETTWAFWQVPS